MISAPAAHRARPKRPAAWKFTTLDTLRHRIIQRAGRLTQPQGELTLTMSANQCSPQRPAAFSRRSPKGCLIKNILKN